MAGRKYCCDVQHRPRIITNIDAGEAVSFRIDGVASFASLKTTLEKFDVWAKFEGVSQGENLAPSVIGYLDRRLGVRSLWFSV
jgi:hypothetical protein